MDKRIVGISMNIRNSQLYRNDLQLVLKHYSFDFLDNKRVFVTGGTGLIGSAIIDLLLEYSDIDNRNLEIIVAARNENIVSERFGNHKNLTFFEYDALSPLELNEKVDFIIHGAGNASPELYVSHAVETMIMNIVALNELLSYAKDNKVQKFLYISSSEIYGK